MNRRCLSRGLLAFLVALALVSMLGCGAHRTDIARPAPVISSGAYNAGEVSVAVGPDGSHHMLYTETNDAGHTYRLVYAYQKFAETPKLLVIQPETGYQSNTDPDIAVTDDGDVYISWITRANGDGPYWPCAAKIDPGATNPPACVKLSQYQTDSRETPVLAAHGNTVYAVYTYSDSGKHYITTNRIDPPAFSAQDLRESQFSIYYYGVDAKVDSSGFVHVVYAFVEDGNFGLDYTVYEPEAGTDSRLTTFPIGNPSISEPVMDIYYNSDLIAEEAVFYTYNTTSLGVTTMHLDRWVGDTQTQFTPLDPSEGWYIPGSTALTVVENTVFLLFSGRRTGSDNELWEGDLPRDAVPGTISFINYTNNPETESVPRAVTMAQQTGSIPPMTGGPVVFFRTFNSGSYSDAYEFDTMIKSDGGYVRKIFTSPGTHVNPNYDIAARGDSVFAAWIDLQSASSSRLVPWISYNIDTAYIPLIQH